MWCPNCGTYVASGDICDRCGASLPAGAGVPHGLPPRITSRNAPRTPPRNAPRTPPDKKSAKEKRAGTLGDLFKGSSPFTGPQPVQPVQPAQKPPRSRGQAFLAWRDTRRGGAPAAPPPPKPAAPPKAAPPPKPTRQPPVPSQRRSKSPIQQPPERSGRSPDYLPGGQPPPAANDPLNDPTNDPWSGTYGSPGGASAPVQAPPQADDPWAADREWSVLPQTGPTSGPASGPLVGSSSGWRSRSPMVDLGEEDPEWLAVPRYGQDGAPDLRTALARRAAATISRGATNLLLIGLILVILAIPIAIGLTHLASLNPQPTPAVQARATQVPTAPVADGFTGYSATLFSFSYPSAWQHTATTQQFSDGTPAHADSFTDGQGTTAALYTTLGTANLLQPYLDELASDTAINASLKPLVLATTHTYDAVKWVESDYTFSGIVKGKPAQIQMRVLAAIQGATAYFFVLTAPQSSFGHANAADFGPLLASFRFN